MNEFLKNIINNFFEFDEIDYYDDNISSNQEKNYNYKKLLYLIGFISLTLISIYVLYTLNNNFNTSNLSHLSNLNEIGEKLYKLSAELSNSSTVCSWEIIHQILKDVEKGDILKLINELELLKEMNIANPGKFSTNSNSFEKSLIKLIKFFKDIS